MTDKRYADAIGALCTTYFSRLKGPDNAFDEQKFVTDMKRKIDEGYDLSPNMKRCIDKMVATHVEGKRIGTTSGRGNSPTELDPIERGRFSAYKATGGFQIHIDGKKAGVPVDHASASTIIYWLEEAIVDIAALLEPQDAAPAEPGNPF